MPSRSQSGTLRILIVEHQMLWCEALRVLLEKQPGYKVVGEAGSCSEAIDLLRREKPHLVLLNLQLADESLPHLLETANTLKHKPSPSRGGEGGISTKVVVLAGSGTPEEFRRVIVMGVKGLVSVHQPAATLLTAITRACEGEVWIAPELMTQILAITTPGESKEQNSEKRRIASLTEREIEVIQLLAEGLKNHEIGERLFLSEGSVRHYLNRVFTKLEISDRSKLLIYAFRHGIAKPY